MYMYRLLKCYPAGSVGGPVILESDRIMYINNPHTQSLHVLSIQY